MDDDFEENPEQYCRTCTKKLDSKEFNILEMPHLSLWLTMWVCLEIDIEDQLPKHLCQDCFDKIEDFYNFGEMCAESAKKFYKIFNKSSELVAEDIKLNLCTEENKNIQIVKVNISQAKEANRISDPLDNIKDELQTALEEEDEEGENVGNSSVDKNLGHDDDDDDDDDVNEKHLEPNFEEETFTMNEPFDCEVVITKHRGEKPWSCMHCEKSYTKRETLQSHIKAYHQDDPEIFSCPIKDCDKSYKLKYSLNKHLKVHHKNEMKDSLSHNQNVDEIPFDNDTMEINTIIDNKDGKEIFTCIICNKNYLNKENYEACIKKHQGIKPWSCTHCEKTYRKKESLQKHIKACHDDNPEIFVCPIQECGSSYKLKDSLQKHCKIYHNVNYNSFCQTTKDDNKNENLHDQNTKLEKSITTTIENNINKYYECEICQKKFIKKELYDACIKKHQGLKPWSCSHCEKTYRKRESLQNHVKAYHQDNPEIFQCPVKSCKRIYKLKYSLHKHCKIYHAINYDSMAVEIDNKTKNDNNENDDNNESNETDNEYNNIVNDDDKTTKKKVDMTKTPGFTCEICQKKFSKKETYEACLKKHQGLKPWSCKICGKEYQKRITLRYHIDGEHSENPTLYPCKFEGCSKTFKIKDTMQKHYELYHLRKYRPRTDRRFMCQECGKCFKFNNQLTLHMYTHTKAYPFKCERCPKRFGTKYQLNIHYKRHDGITNFVCTICGMKKITKRSLKIHMNIHSRENVQKCKYCDYTTCHAGYIADHERVVHFGERPFKCNYCTKSFGKAYTLKCHEMIHTGEKACECKLCGRKFIQLTSLKSHMKCHAKGTIKSL